MRRLLKDPLLHFLLLGAVLFAVDAGREGTDELTPRQLRVDAATQQRLAALWERKWLRPPTPAEMQGLVDGHIREEILYREALALGLERDDTIVRRRLAQKLEFLFEDLVQPVDPTPAELAAWYEARRDAYRQPERFHFVQLYFSPDRPGTAAADDAEQALLALRAAGGSPAATGRGLGDATLLPFELSATTPDRIDRQFGPGFADRLAEQPDGRWSGPIESTFGLHLVYVLRRDSGRLPPLDAVRDVVLRDYLREQREAANEAMYQELRSRYRIVVETPESAS